MIAWLKRLWNRLFGKKPTVVPPSDDGQITVFRAGGMM
jgi:hypothetical protein